MLEMCWFRFDGREALAVVVEKFSGIKLEVPWAFWVVAPSAKPLASALKA